MSRRNSPEAKAVRRRLRSLTKGTLPAQVDLIEWIKLRANVTTTEAVNLILAGTLRVDSHKIGIHHTPRGPRLNRYVPADVARRIQIVVPEVLHESDED